MPFNVSDDRELFADEYEKLLPIGDEAKENEMQKQSHRNLSLFNQSNDVTRNVDLQKQIFAN